MDHKAAREGLFSFYYPEPANAGESEAGRETLPFEDQLSNRNREHLSFAAEEVRRLGQTCLALSRRYPDREALFARERTLILLNQISNELFTMSVTLARASTLSGQGHLGADTLADTYCTAGRHRVVDLFRQVEAEAEPDFAAASGAWLSGYGLEFLLQDVIGHDPGR